MSYKETLYFIAKCLTISFEDKNRIEIEKKLKKNSINWDTVVEVSTSHYVFPALYCNLKREGFLHFLPQDLVTYMEYITSLNRTRNQQIIIQAKDLNKLLLANNITPIFIKGTGNLLADLYEDIGERMVGDIDFIFSKEDYPKAISVLRNNGYSEVGKYKYHFPAKKHYRRLNKRNFIAAIEIHKELLLEEYSNEFNYSFVKKDSQIINGVSVLSYANKLNLSIIANQINDYGFYYKSIALRNAYDVLLISKKTIAKNAFSKLDKLKHPLNCFLAVCYHIFNRVDSLEFNNSAEISSYISLFNSRFTNIRKTRIKNKIIKSYLYVKVRLNILNKVILYKDSRLWLIRRLTDKNRYKEKLLKFIEKIKQFVFDKTK